VTSSPEPDERRLNVALFVILFVFLTFGIALVLTLSRLHGA